MKVQLTIELPDLLGADLQTDWLTTTKATGTMQAIDDTTLTLGQSLTGINAGDTILVEAEQVVVVTPPAKDGDVVGITRSAPVAHAAGAPVAVLTWQTPFSPTHPVLQQYAIGVAVRLATEGRGQTFAGSVTGVILPA